MMRSPVKVHMRATSFFCLTLVDHYMQAKYSRVQHCYRSMWLYAALSVIMGAYAYEA